MLFQKKTLTQNAVHLYLACFKNLNPNDFMHALNQEDLHYIEKFSTTKLQETALLSRALTRLILAQYLNINPAELPLIRQDLQKPKLNEAFHNYHFNVSHTKTYYALALTLDKNIGVDIEEKNERLYQDISKRFFHPKEHEQINKAENPEDYFFRIWTQKEAFVKAIGVGLSFDLKKFYVDPEQIKIIEILDSNYQADAYHSKLMHLPHNHYLCITAEKSLAQLQFFNLTTID